jgi:hypothetical protein
MQWMQRIAWLLMCACAAGTGQVAAHPAMPPFAHKGRKIVHPVQLISVSAYGYQAPGVLPALDNYMLVSMNFLDEEHLLFAFNVPALVEHNAACAVTGGAIEHVEHAVVLDLKTGQGTWQTDWTLDDYGQFLWQIPNGEVLLRRCAKLSTVDTKLHEQPLLAAQGEALLLEMSPDGADMLLEWRESDLAMRKEQTSGAQNPRRIRADFISLNPLGILARTQIDVPVYVPLLHDGYLQMESLPHDRWQVELQPYHGNLQVVTTVRSGCLPRIQTLTRNTFYLDTCGENFSSRSMEAFDLAGHRLWHAAVDLNSIRPRLVLAQGLSVFAVARLELRGISLSYAALDPIGPDSLAGQKVNVYASQTGRHLLSAMATPIYTAGGNFALSPNGDRLAILQNGMIAIYPLQK